MYMNSTTIRTSTKRVCCSHRLTHLRNWIFPKTKTLNYIFIVWYKSVCTFLPNIYYCKNLFFNLWLHDRIFFFLLPIKLLLSCALHNIIIVVKETKYILCKFIFYIGELALKKKKRLHYNKPFIAVCLV